MKPLQGNLDFFLIRASQVPFRLKQKTQGPSHIHIPNGKLQIGRASCRESAGCQWYWEGEGVRSDDAEDAVLVSSLGTAQGPG